MTVSSPKVFSIYAASSADARGTIPGSLNAVRKSVDMTKTNNHAARNGTTGDRCVKRYGELSREKNQTINKLTASKFRTHAMDQQGCQSFLE